MGKVSLTATNKRLMVITIDRVEVLSDVRRESEYEGMKSGKYDQMRIIDEDEELLSRMISDACLTLESELRDISHPAVAAGQTWSLTTRHENGRDKWASAAAQSYVEKRVLSEWMQRVMPEKQAQYTEASNAKLAEVLRLAYYRLIN